MKTAVVAVLLRFSHTSFATDPKLDKVVKAQQSTIQSGKLGLIPLRGLVRESDAIVSSLNSVHSGKYSVSYNYRSIEERVKRIAASYRGFDAYVVKEMEPCGDPVKLNEIQTENITDWVSFEHVTLLTRDISRLDRLIQRQRKELELSSKAGEIVSDKVAASLQE